MKEIVKLYLLIIHHFIHELIFNMVLRVLVLGYQFL